jgi:hypothetical protein
MKKISLALVVALGFGVGQASAATLEISYDLETTYTLQGVGTLGPASTGSMTIAYSATGGGAASQTYSPGGGAANPLHGPIHLSLANLPPLFVNVTIAGDTITGTLLPTNTGLVSLGGSLMSTGALTIGPINIWDLGSLHCLGATCTALGFIAQSVPQMFTIGQAALVLSFPNAATPGSNLNLGFSGSANVGSLFGYNVIAQTTGQEVGRHFTPEPGTVSLLGLGLLGLGVAGAASRARRAQR